MIRGDDFQALLRTTAALPGLSDESLWKVIRECEDILRIRGSLQGELPQTDNPVLERRETGRITYQLEMVSCGKPGCKKCPHGHGPYWYSYYWEMGRQVSKYIGKRLPSYVGDDLAENVAPVASWQNPVMGDGQAGQ